MDPAVEEKLSGTQHEEAVLDLPLVSYDQALEKATLLRLDCLVLPIMAMLYLLSIMDRSNVGNARIAGMQKDLKLTDWEYQVGEFLR